MITNLLVCSVIGIKFWLFCLKSRRKVIISVWNVPHRLVCLDVVPQWVALFGEPANLQESGQLKEVSRRTR